MKNQNYDSEVFSVKTLDHFDKYYKLSWKLITRIVLKKQKIIAKTHITPETSEQKNQLLNFYWLKTWESHQKTGYSIIVVKISPSFGALLMVRSTDKSFQTKKQASTPLMSLHWHPLIGFAHGSDFFLKKSPVPRICAQTCGGLLYKWNKNAINFPRIKNLLSVLFLK